MWGPPPELERVLRERGKRQGRELVFACPFPGQHEHGDVHPSARYSSAKAVWYCDVCGNGGGWKKLCELLGIPVVKPSRSQVTTRYTYCDEDGTGLRRKVRWEPGFRGRMKSFTWEKPAGRGDWVKCQGDGNPNRLYGSEKLPEARKAQRRVVAVEGEKDADTAHRIGLVAVCNPEGAASEKQRPKWKTAYSEQLCGLPVVVIADKDGPGRAHASATAQSLSQKASSVQVLELPGEKVKDLSDWVGVLEQAGKSKDEIVAQLEALIEQAPAWKPEAHSASIDAKDEDETQAQILLRIVELAGVELFHTPDCACYATVPVGDHFETWRIRDRSFKRWLVGAFYKLQKKPPSSQPLSDTLTMLEAKAQFDGPERQVHIRVAGTKKAVYLDLGDPNWKVVEIDVNGWRLTARPPVKFRRSRGMLALAEPVAGGSLEELKRFVNLQRESDFVLCVAWLVGSLRPEGPYPVLDVQGEQGATKSSLCRFLRMLVDPAKPMLRSPPKNELDLVIAANNCWALTYDNLSGLPLWLSDALCRLATGGGLSTRELYTNDEETIFEAKRPTIVNGIDAVATRQDLVDRCVILNLPAIPKAQRRTEKELWREFEAARPRILGALLDAVSAALGNLRKVELKTKPRMADFATWVVAAEPSLPWQPGAFMVAYGDNRAGAIEEALEADVVATAVRELLNGVAKWEGTASELLERLETRTSESVRRSRTWPKSPRGLSGKLTRAASFLRKVGIEIEQGTREPGTGRRLIILRKLDTTPIREVGPVTVTTVTTVTAETQVVEGKELAGVTVDDGSSQLKSSTVTDRHAAPLRPEVGQDNDQEVRL